METRSLNLTLAVASILFVSTVVGAVLVWDRLRGERDPGVVPFAGSPAPGRTDSSQEQTDAESFAVLEPKLAARVRTDRFREMTLTVEGDHPRRAWLDGEPVASGGAAKAETGKEPEKVSGKIQIPTGTHLLVIRTILDPALEEEWTAGAILEAKDEKAGLDGLSTDIAPSATSRSTTSSTPRRSPRSPSRPTGRRSPRLSRESSPAPTIPRPGSSCAPPRTAGSCTVGAAASR